MAQEITLSVNIAQTKNGVTFSKDFTGQFDVTGNTPISNVQNIGTSDETLALGDISTIGYIALRNLDNTNFIDIGYTSGTYFARLKRGEFMVMRGGPGLTAIHAKADTAVCNLEYLLLPD